MIAPLFAADVASQSPSWVASHAQQIQIALGALLAALALWLILPRASQRGRILGGVLGIVSLGLFAAQFPRLGDWLDDSMFVVLATLTVLAAAAAMTFRNPVYCAIWFALALLGTAGLFFFQGAQFLGVATVVVYAGAILVTFLFVLMLANPKGEAYYDRVSWEAWISAPAAAVMVAVLTVSLSQNVAAAPPAPQSQADLDRNILAPQHMAHLGKHLFSEYLIAVEVAGTLLLVGLVGAVAIVAADKELPGRAGATPASFTTDLGESGAGGRHA
ncbi:MAG: NADH-quinone oxidoreductase subunit J [Planctomycetaceae bacterium]|nr:NADH-quinone oxidoreductase subunit J [Planctomycetaceae bacterium]